MDAREGPVKMASERGGKGALTGSGLSPRSFLFFQQADFRLTMLGEQIIECLGSQVVHGGLLFNCHNFELVADLYWETDGDGNGILLARLLAGLQLMRGRNRLWLAAGAAADFSE